VAIFIVDGFLGRRPQCRLWHLDAGSGAIHRISLRCRPTAALPQPDLRAIFFPLTGRHNTLTARRRRQHQRAVEPEQPEREREIGSEGDPGGSPDALT
jgi:hypothetical protein